MNPDRFARLRAVILGAEGLPPGERCAYLDRECGDDAELRRDVESLLEVDPEAGLPRSAQTGGALGILESTHADDGRAPQSVPERVGPYRVVGELGRGGMGVVYRGHDDRLDRDVALKMLPEAYAKDPHHLRRFAREAQLLAALNHPRIAQIYGLEESGDAHVLVMELVKGELLSTHIDRSPIPLEEALRTASQIAEALEAAHEGGIVHRDLKPGNVVLTPTGEAKVLDFGIAKVVEADTGERQTIERLGTSTDAGPSSSERTTQRLILGTAAYMSPEQARGKAVDKRTDIWSFGCVLYEMLTGRRAFPGETTSDTLAAVLTRDPDWSVLPTGIPWALRGLLGRCLQRDVNERLRDIGDVRLFLSDALLWREESEREEKAAGTPVRKCTLTFSGRDNLSSASPDGHLIAFVSDRDGRSRIWIKDLSTGGEQPITDGPDTAPRFSPDGGRLLFLRAGQGRQDVYRQAVVGGQPRKVIDDALEACWSSDGQKIAYLQRLHHDEGSTLNVVDGQSGAELELHRTRRQLYGLRWSSGADIAVVEGPPTGKSTGFSLLVLRPLQARSPSAGAIVQRIPVPGPPISGPAWNGARRQLIYAQAGSVMGDHGDTVSRVLLLDLDSGIERTLFFAEGLFPGLGQWSLGRGTSLEIVRPGTLVFGTNLARQRLREIVLGEARAPRLLTSGESRDRQPTYSHDGTLLAFSSNRSGHLDLWTLDIQTGALRQLTGDRAQDWDPAFTADGQHLLWSSNRSGHLEVWMAGADGSGARIVTRDGHDAQNPSPTGNGRWIVYWSSNPEKAGIWKVRPDGTDAAQLVPGRFSLPESSPDGRWACFLSQEPHYRRSVLRVVELDTSRLVPFEITVQWPSVRSEDVIMGRMRWMPDSRTIAFVGADNRGRFGVYVQDFLPGRDTQASRRPMVGFDEDFPTESFAISPDGTRVTISGIELTKQLVLAEGLTGVGR